MYKDRKSTIVKYSIICIIVLAYDAHCVEMINFFNGACPDGWSEYTAAAGRTIIAAGTGTDTNNLSQTFSLLGKGGEYTHTLSIA
jgi:hypothetical protein